MSAPLLSAHALPFPQPFPPLSYEASYGPISNPPLSQSPGVPTNSFSNQAQGRSPHPLDSSHQVYYPTPPRTYPYVLAHPRPPPAFRNGPMNQRTNLGGLPEPSDWYTRTENPLLHSSQPFFPSYPGNYDTPLSPPAGPAPLPRRQHYSMMGIGPPPRYFGQEPVRTPHNGVPDQPRQMQSPNRRTSHQDQFQPHNRTYDHLERRSSLFLPNPGRRSDRSVSPRTSNRRSFDRYSFDLSQASTSSDAEEAAARAPPSNRMRHRPREVRPRFMGHHHQQFDPNIATPRQIQELKDKLPRRLPSELPKETSTACDICSKDYSICHVQPVEEEEIAIELPCGHVFGEFCIFQWVCARSRVGNLLIQPSSTPAKPTRTKLPVQCVGSNSLNHHVITQHCSTLFLVVARPFRSCWPTSFGAISRTCRGQLASYTPYRCGVFRRVMK